MDRGRIFAGPQRAPEGLPPIGQNTNVFRPGQGMQPAPGSSPGVPAPVHPPDGPEVKPKIQAFEKSNSIGRTEDLWKRQTNKTGVGATHVKSFHAKLTGESLEFLDKQINEWLDAHPDHEVKFSTATVGEWTGKLREPNLIVQVWV
jgi:hypothetical protein